MEQLLFLFQGCHVGLLPDPLAPNLGIEFPHFSPRLIQPGKKIPLIQYDQGLPGRNPFTLPDHHLVYSRGRRSGRLERIWRLQSAVEGQRGCQGAGLHFHYLDTPDSLLNLRRGLFRLGGPENGKGPDTRGENQDRCENFQDRFQRWFNLLLRQTSRFRTFCSGL